MKNTTIKQNPFAGLEEFALTAEEARMVKGGFDIIIVGGGGGPDLGGGDGGGVETQGRWVNVRWLPSGAQGEVWEDDHGGYWDKRSGRFISVTRDVDFVLR